jgi:L-glutamine-phosphate cytidylyltransferase
MRALILAAGRGSRMRSLTRHRPKCLVPFAGRPLLHWQLAALRAAGLDQIAIVGGYLREALVAPGCTHLDNPRWAQTNMVATLACADAWLRADSCIVSYADIVYHPNHIRALARVLGDIAITYDRLWKQLWIERFNDPLGDAETFRRAADGTLTEIGGRAESLQAIEGQYMGLLRFTPASWARIRGWLEALPPAARDRLDMTGLLRRLLAQGTRIDTVPVEGRWCEVDSDEDLALYESRLNDLKPWRHDWRWEKAA